MSERSEQKSPDRNRTQQTRAIGVEPRFALLRPWVDARAARSENGEYVKLSLQRWQGWGRQQKQRERGSSCRSCGVAARSVAVSGRGERSSAGCGSSLTVCSALACASQSPIRYVCEQQGQRAARWQGAHALSSVAADQGAAASWHSSASTRHERSATHHAGDGRLDRHRIDGHGLLIPAPVVERDAVEDLERVPCEHTRRQRNDEPSAAADREHGRVMGSGHGQGTPGGE